MKEEKSLFEFGRENSRTYRHPQTCGSLDQSLQVQPEMWLYEIDPPKEDFFTTWKTRGTHTVKRIIDYIFHSEELDCTATLSIPSTNELEEGKLPGLRQPSDHLMIAAKFRLPTDT